MPSKIKVHEPDKSDWNVFKVPLLHTMRKKMQLFGKEKAKLTFKAVRTALTFLAGKSRTPFVSLFAFLVNVKMSWSSWPSVQHLDRNHHLFYKLAFSPSAFFCWEGTDWSSHIWTDAKWFRLEVFKTRCGKMFDKSRARQLCKIKNVHHEMRPGLKCCCIKKEALRALFF